VKEHRKEGICNGLNIFHVSCRAIPPMPCTEVQKVSRGKKKKKILSTITRCSTAHVYADCWPH